MDKEALITLAETLDHARLQANAIEATAPQSGVYGRIVIAEIETLSLITDAYTSQRVYDEILNSGISVREALAALEASK